MYERKLLKCKYLIGLCDIEKLCLSLFCKMRCQKQWKKIWNELAEFGKEWELKEMLAMRIPCINQKNLTLLTFQLWSWRIDINKHSNMRNNNLKSLDTN